MSAALSIARAYERAAIVMEKLTNGSLSVETAGYRLEEINALANVSLRCDPAYLQQVKDDHQKTTVFKAMQGEDEDYESSDGYEDSDC